MIEATFRGAEVLVRTLDEAVALGDPKAVTEGVKRGLSTLIGEGALELPAELTRAQEECYARRLLYRSERLGYEVIAMIWGPGQGTPLHDHAGIWCVDGVLDGEVSVTQYDLLEQQGHRFRFQPQETIEAGCGMAGSLIPPFEYHTIQNSLSDRSSVTIHVYGGRMDHCTIFEPREDGWYERKQKELTYSAGGLESQ